MSVHPSVRHGILPTLQEFQIKYFRVFVSHFVDGVLVYVDLVHENNLCLNAPALAKQKLMEEAHAESMAGQFAPKSVYKSAIVWIGCTAMYMHIVDYALPVQLMVAQVTNRKPHSSLFQCWILWSQHHADAQTDRPNRYVIVFMDNLTKIKWLGGLKIRQGNYCSIVSGKHCTVYPEILAVFKFGDFNSNRAI